MRCPNPICRMVFEVADETMLEASGVSAPVAAAASVAGEPPPHTTAPPKWAAPPPVRTSAPPIATTLPPSADFDFPSDIPGDEPTAEAPAVLPPEAPRQPDAKSPMKTKRGPLLFVGALFLVLAVAAGVAVQQFVGRQNELEAKLAAQAHEHFQKGDFAEAMKRFQDVERRYPNSAAAGRYRFLATFSELRVEIDAANDLAALADARRHALEFLDTYQETPHLTAHESDAFDALLPLAKRFTQAALETPDIGLLDQAKSTWERTRPLAPRSVAREDEYFNGSFATLRTTLADRQRRQTTLAAVQSRLTTPTAAAVAEARKVAGDAKLADDPEIAAALKSLREAHKASIVFVPPGPPLSPPADDPFPLLPIVGPQSDAIFVRGENPVIALTSTGVLYALHARTGELIWARRLGIDSRIVPLRLTADAGAPPRFLALANDSKTVYLLDGFLGKTLWRHVLSAPAIAEPIVAGGHLLISLQTGRVEDLNPATGELRGSFQFDQPLSTGGTHHPGTALVTFAGDANCLYVVDLTTRSCVRIIETGHPAGSLVGPPIFIPGAGAKNWLVLTQAEPGPGILLRPIPYPPESAGKRLERDLRLPGTLSFPPQHDAESILLATDEGTLHRIGIRQPGNGVDPLLFPLTPAEIALDAPPRGQAMKSQVVHVDAENIWVMSAGRLQRLRQSFSPQSGPAVKAVWPRGTRLGEPLHAAHVHADAEGTILFLTTVDAETGANSLTAVDGDTGKIFWQTQLGSQPRTAPTSIAGKIVWLDSKRVYFDSVARLAQSAQVPVASLPIPVSQRGCLVPVGATVKDESATIVGWSPALPTVTLTELLVSGASMRQAREVSLAAPPAAAPVGVASAQSEGTLFVALANGTLARISLVSATATNGPDWRAPGADPDALPHLVAVRSDFLVVTNGKGGLTGFSWGKAWNEAARWQPTDQPLVGAPVLVPGAEPKLLAVDAGGKLTLLDALRLQPLPRKDWSLPGRLTAGPFAVGANAYVVVDGKRLVAYDLAGDGPAWEANFTSTVALSPVMSGDRLVVVDQSGNFWTLDPKTGANLTGDDRPALSVRANLVPAVPALPLADGQLFVIWSDGAATILPIP